MNQIPEAVCDHEWLTFNVARAMSIESEGTLPVISVYQMSAECGRCDQRWFGESPGTFWLKPEPGSANPAFDAGVQAATARIVADVRAERTDERLSHARIDAALDPKERSQ